jgi:hypothetical protein
LFSEDKQLDALWQAYVREVWGRVYKPELMKKFDCDERTQEFLDEFPNFKSEVKSLISFNAGSSSEERYEYFLKKGKTGVNESDYELRRAAD